MSREKKISKKKLEAVKNLSELLKKSGTIIIASIKNLPSSQFQDIKKKLRGKAEAKVIKKNIMLKSIEASGRKDIELLKNYVQENSAVLFSNEDAFDLISTLAENKNPIKAKPGQITAEEIAVEEGLTDLTPGPAISELGNLGIKIAVEEGKISIKERKIIVKKGEKISDSASSIMAKLDIMPFKIGLEPIAIFDSKSRKIYTDIRIDKEKTAEELKISASKAMGFAQKIIYLCKETISFLLAKASAEEKALEKTIQKETKSEEVK